MERDLDIDRIISSIDIITELENEGKNSDSLRRQLNHLLKNEDIPKTNRVDLDNLD